MKRVYFDEALNSAPDLLKVLLSKEFKAAMQAISKEMVKIWTKYLVEEVGKSKTRKLFKKLAIAARKPKVFSKRKLNAALD